MRATLDDGDLLTEQQQKNHLKMAQAISGHVHVRLPLPTQLEC